jgi:Protein of unknown function (DUF4011)/REase_MTES_1575/AAA domain
MRAMSDGSAAGSDAGAARAAELTFDAAAATAASIELNGVPCVRAIIVKASMRIHGCSLRIAIEGNAGAAYERGVEPIAAGESAAVDVSDFMIPLTVLRKSTEREALDLVASLIDAEGLALATARHRLVIVPATHWCGITIACESLASFITPNAQAIHQLLLDASARLEKRTKSGALDGYLSQSPERAQRIAEACYEALAARGISYVTAKPSFEEAGQKVRTLPDTLADGTANCLDLSVAFAALLEACGLAPVIAMGDGHAVVGYATVDEPFADAVHEGPSRLVNRIELSQFRMIEATGVCGARLSYGEALAEGERFLRRATDALRVLDVRAARRAGYHPLPERIAEDRSDANTLRRVPKATSWRVVQPAGLPPLPRIRLAPHEQRLELWKKKLLDLTLRNRLLNDRDKAGIPLLLEGDDVLARLEDIVWNEKPFKLVARGSVRAADGAAMLEELGRGWMRATLDEAELFKRATKAYREGRSSLEETGARSLYVAVGFLEYRVEGRDAPVLAPLLLAPAEMERISRSEGFRVIPVAEDTVPNVALVEYLRNSHGLDIGLSGAIPEDEHGVDVPSMLARVRQAVADVPGARVIAMAKLGNYSFKKLPIFEEMRARVKPLGDHPVVRSLLDRGATDALRRVALVSPEDVDAAAPFTKVRFPLAADSSQIAAICSATAGATFVLQGPPGTGKSQTITNLLSECLARGKRVLFIAEKSAALEVVADRLRKAGLGSFALDLHADHATKPSFVAQIKTALDELETRAAPGARQFESVAAGVDKWRVRLRASCQALHAARGAGMTAHGAIQRGVALADAHSRALEPALEGALASTASAADVDARVDAAVALARSVEELPAGAAEAFSDCTPTEILTAERATMVAKVAAEASALAGSAEQSASELARMIGAAPPRTAGSMAELAKAARGLAITAPGAAHLVECALAADAAQRLAQLAKSLDACEAADRARADVTARYDAGVLALPLAQLVGDLRASRERFIVFRWLAVKKVRGELVRLARTAPASDHEELLKETEQLRAAAEVIKSAEPHRVTLARVSSPDGTVDFASVRRALAQVQSAGDAVRRSFVADLGSIAAQAPRVAADPRLVQSAESLERTLERMNAALTEIDRTLGARPPLADPASAILATRERLDRIAGNPQALPAWSACAVARSHAARLGLAQLSKSLISGALPTAAAERATEAALLTSWVRARLREEAALADCASDKLDEIRRIFGSSVGDYRKGAADAVAAIARDRANEALEAVTTSEAMRRAHKTVLELRALSTIRRPIRRVMMEGAPAIAAIKPIVLASPLSAATLLPPEFPPFDLVVFDEASQVPVWDAACAISRASAAVIVGDSKQLPPTNFFERKDAGDSGDAEAELADALEPLESVLDEAVAAGIPQRSLLWHYRSRDERLIEFSNRKSYGSRLQTFPAPHRAHPNLGVEFRFVGGVYDGGGTRTNRAEAEAVVKELSRRLLDDDACSANRSIGVVTFSEAQQTLVQDLLDEAVDRDPKLGERMADAARLGDPVFVKNLENVQGDERATMLFSICYGRDAAGKLALRFGPLNLSGGERRLNVAVTRAREKIVLFTSIRASDIDPARCSAKGAQDLRDYLAFAELGTVPPSRGEGAPARGIDVSPVERAIADALAARGWRVDLHVGRSRDFRISIALADKAKPDHWILGVELDGDFYGAAPTVVDREIVRDGVLGALGWRTIKISCIDWLRDPAKTLDRIEQAARGA